MIDRKISKRLRSRGGFSIAEMLVTVIILLLVSGGVAEGIRFGTEQYRKSMLLSEGKVLCSTLTSIIQSELSDTNVAHLVKAEGDGSVEDVNDYRAVDVFFSSVGRCSLIPVTVTKNDADGTMTISKADDDYGELLLGTVDAEGAVTGDLLLGSKAYTTYKLRVKAAIEYNPTKAIFRVKLQIRAPGEDKDILESTFSVLPLNKVKPEWAA